MSATSTTRGLVPVRPISLAPVLDDLGLSQARARTIDAELGDRPPRESVMLVGVEAALADPARLAPEILALARRGVGENGALFVLLLGERDARTLAKLRDALWPLWHVVALYSTSQSGLMRRTLEGERHIEHGVGHRGVVMVAHARAAVMAPDATVAKFDLNAAGWNGTPGVPGWRHHRWMRRFVGTFADASGARRILDFGCGAGWVGIEAVLAARKAGAEPFLAAFDPSPLMVKSFEDNARASGLTRFEARTGFGEAPPFPASGEEPFDLVISSGVVSFAPDRERWLDGLVSTLARRGTLVVGDIQRESLGMRARRAEKPLLPVRELNASTHAEIRAALQARGLTFVKTCGYQRTKPMPQLLHLDATQLGGTLERLFVAWNERAARKDLAQKGAHPELFDSWVIEMRNPAQSTS